MNRTSFSSISEPDAVDQVLEIPQAVLGDDDRLALLFPFADDLVKLLDRLKVQIRRGFIEQDDLRKKRRDRRAGDPLLLASRQFKETSSQKFCKVHLIDDHVLSVEDRLRGQTYILRSEDDLSVSIDGEELTSRVLKHRPDNARQLVKFDLSDFKILDENIAGHLSMVIVRDQSVDQADHGSLAGAGRTAQKKRLSFRYRKRDTLDRVFPGTLILVGDITYINYSFH